jgi:hypothetical protein
MSAAREFIEQSIGRPLKSGSLGRVTVDQVTQRTWTVLLEPGYDGRAGTVRVTSKAAAHEAIRLWAEWRQTRLGLDIGTYTAEVPVGFNPKKSEAA